MLWQRKILVPAASSSPPATSDFCVLDKRMVFKSVDALLVSPAVFLSSQVYLSSVLLEAKERKQRTLRLRSKHAAHDALVCHVNSDLVEAVVVLGHVTFSLVKIERVVTVF